MTFSEANTVEQMILDGVESAGWNYVAGPLLDRQPSEVFVESSLRKALIQLNPEIAEQPDRADVVVQCKRHQSRTTGRRPASYARFSA